MAAILGEGKFFLNCQEYNAQTPVGRKFWRNRSISHG